MEAIDWSNAESIIKLGGFLLIVLTVYAETGIIFCFFLPGDYLLFAAGLFATPEFEILNVPIWLLCISLWAAAVAGNFTGYFFGKVLGNDLENRKENFFFKRKYIDNTRKVFDKYGGRALVIGRFLPVVRTFAPVLAGMIRMDLKTFTLYNVLGAGLWVGILCLSGYYLGEFYGRKMLDYLPYIIGGFLIFTTSSVLYNAWKLRNEARKN
jgi:membrane-associated protein